MKTNLFISFGAHQNGRIITSFRCYGEKFVVVSGRNPYGSHNLVLCSVTAVIQDEEELTAFRHGNGAVMAFVAKYSKKAFKRVIAYVLKKGWEWHKGYWLSADNVSLARLSPSHWKLGC